MDNFDRLKILFKSVYDKDARFMLMDRFGLCNGIADDEFLRRKFHMMMGKELNLEKPSTFNEKLQWLKLYERNPLYTIMVDKYLVKKYVADIIGEEYIIPTIGVWDDPDEIDFNSLPMKFVLKCNHNSGLGMCICRDKDALNIKKVKFELKKGLAQDYYLHGREWPYKNVIRKIIAEEYLEDESGELPDYKVLCFNGEPKLIELHTGRFTCNHCQDYYDTTWKRTEYENPPTERNKYEVPAPVCLKEMLDLTRKLSKDLIHVRIDWYYVNGRLYFGEITFFDGSGWAKFKNYEQDLEIGELIKLPID